MIFVTLQQHEKGSHEIFMINRHWYWDHALKFARWQQCTLLWGAGRVLLCVCLEHLIDRHSCVIDCYQQVVPR